MNKIIPIIVTAVVFALGGYMFGTSQAPSMEEEMNMESEADHAHSETLELSEATTVPTITVEAFPDLKSGVNVKTTVTDFIFAPERASTEHVEGEGHAHIYVDGMKMGRVYGQWHHLDGLEDGDHEIKVTLNANSHEALTIDGVKIEGTSSVSINPIVNQEESHDDSEMMDEGTENHEEGDEHSAE